MSYGKFLKKISPIYWLLLISIVLFVLLTIGNLNKSILWGDESYRAQISYNTLKKGYPTHWDGNSYVIGVAEEKCISRLFPGKYIDFVSGWLQYYLIAISYFIFGVSTWSARLPFWLAGMLTFLVIFKYRYLFHSTNEAPRADVRGIFSAFGGAEIRRSRKSLPSSPDLRPWSSAKADKTYLLIATMLLTNVTFLIYSRQANYYIYAILLTLLSTLIFFNILYKKSPTSAREYFFLFIVNQFLIHSHLPTFVVLFVIQTPVLLYLAFFGKKNNLKAVIVYTLFSTIFLFIALKIYGNNSFVLGRYLLANLVTYLTDINFYIFPVLGIFLTGLLVIYYRRRIKKKKILGYIFLVTMSEIFLISYVNYGYGTAFRYISSFLALWFVALAIIIVSLPRVWACLVFILVLLSNFNSGISDLFSNHIFPGFFMDSVRREFPTLPLISDNPIRCYFCEYLDEILTSSPHPAEGIINFLNKLGVKDMKMVVGPCEGNTIMFYTQGVVIDQMPARLYQEKYGKSYELYDADVIVDYPFCSAKVDHGDLINNGYIFKSIVLSREAFIHGDELRVRSKFYYPYQPKAVIYVKNKNLKIKLNALFNVIE